MHNDHFPQHKNLLLISGYIFVCNSDYCIILTLCSVYSTTLYHPIVIVILIRYVITIVISSLQQQNHLITTMMIQESTSHHVRDCSASFRDHLHISILWYKVIYVNFEYNSRFHLCELFSVGLLWIISHVRFYAFLQKLLFIY